MARSDLNVARLVAFTVHPKVQHAFALRQIAHPKLTEFLPAQSMIQKRGEDGTIRSECSASCRLYRAPESAARLRAAPDRAPEAYRVPPGAIHDTEARRGWNDPI